METGIQHSFFRHSRIKHENTESSETGGMIETKVMNGAELP